MKNRFWLCTLLVCGILFAGSAARVIAPGLPAPDRGPSATNAASPLSGGTEIDRTGYIKGIYVSYAALGSAEFVRHVQDLLESTELNGVVVDFKSDRGQLTFPSQVRLAHEIGADSETMIPDAAAFLRWFTERRVYLIARIPVFKDNLLAQAHPEWAVTHGDTGQIWRDTEGMGWVDANRAQVWDYNVALAVEAARVGFDEIQFDYVRFPTDGNIGAARFSLANTQENRTAAIVGLLQRARVALAPHRAKLAADVFGYAPWATDDLGIGQQIEALAPHLDVISPMIYPSTFTAGLPGLADRYRNAIAYPSDIVRMSTRRTVDRARAVNPEIDIRPWIQDFQDYAFDYRTYTPAEIREQMEGAREGGGRGWLLWDPAVRYTREALVSAQTRYRPNLAGSVPVIVYGEIGTSDTPGSRLPAQLRADLEQLLAGGFYPVNLRDLVERKLNMVPAGKRPVVLTFDGSTAGQFRLLSNGAVDPATAVGVLLDFHAAHPADWPLRATFFVIPSDETSSPAIFGTAEVAALKLSLLTQWDMEIGAQLQTGQPVTSVAEARRAVEQSILRLEGVLPGYQVVSVAVPDRRSFPNMAVLRDALAATASAIRAVAAPEDGLTPSPLVSRFDPLRIMRIPADLSAGRLTAADRSDSLYVSAGEALHGPP